MNVLIVGEYSGFAHHLKKGFKNLGHKVTVVMWGDGYKQIKPDEDDIYYSPQNLKIFGKSIKGTNRLFTIKWNNYINAELKKKCQNHKIDIIIVINYFFLRTRIGFLFNVGVSISFIKNLLDSGAKLIMSCCGCDPGWSLVHKDLDILNKQKQPLRDRRFDFLIKFSSIIIPTSYTYWLGITSYCNKYQLGLSKISNSIPLPITISHNYSINSCQNRKIIIFHGVNRPQIKGTAYIIEAMNRIQHDFPDRVECIIVTRLPYDEYINLFEKIDILIDQTRENGWGMNANIGAENAKCVLTSCGIENNENMEIPNIPFVKIESDSSQIYNVLKHLVLNPSEIDAIKQRQRIFVEQYCKSEIIAQKYISYVF